MPTLEPSRAGLTTHGKPSGLSASSPVPQGHAAGDGDALVAHDRLEEILVHGEGRRGHARADVGDAGQLQQALHGAVLAERPVEDGEDDVDAAQRLDSAVPAAGTGSEAPTSPSSERPTAGEAPSARRRRSRSRGRRSDRGSRPSTTERPDCRETSRSLERPPISTATRSLAIALSYGLTRRPTTMVTVEPGRACEPPPGLWSRTTPSCDGSVTSSKTVRVRKPASWSAARASLASSPNTSGTVVELGPVEMVIGTVDRRGGLRARPGSGPRRGPRRLVARALRRR